MNIFWLSSSIRLPASLVSEKLVQYSLTALVQYSCSTEQFYCSYVQGLHKATTPPNKFTLHGLRALWSATLTHGGCSIILVHYSVLAPIAFVLKQKM